MSTHEKQTFFATYDWAKTWQDLPWAHDEPTLFLSEICKRRRGGRALDIGCGAGTDSVFLATQGWDVTSLDFMPKALTYTQQRAQAAGVRVTPVEADIAEWQPTGTYDLVLDHGLLHNMDPVRFPAYRATVLKALGPDGDLVLLHWHPRYPNQPNGKMGPRRVSREDIQAFFAPDLQERFFAREEFEDLPDLVGGGMSQAYYWFRRNQSHEKPAELVAQIVKTLQRHKIDTDAQLNGAGEKPIGELPAGLMAKMLGPGRLGVMHRNPEPGEVAGAISALAARAGIAPRRLENLLTIFASDKLSNVCNAGSPKCNACDVVFCKRLRYR